MCLNGPARVKQRRVWRSGHSAACFCLNSASGQGATPWQSGAERIAETYAHLAAEKIFALDPESGLRCADPDAAQRMMASIDRAASAGDTLGGISEIVAVSIPPGLGSHIQWDRRMDAQIAQAMMSIPAVKAVEIGNGIAAARMAGLVGSRRNIL